MVGNKDMYCQNKIVHTIQAGEKRTQREMQIQSLRSAVDKTKQLMQLSSTNYLEVLTAQQSLLNAELSGVKDSFDQIQSVVSLLIKML